MSESGTEKSPFMEVELGQYKGLEVEESGVKTEETIIPLIIANARFRLSPDRIRLVAAQMAEEYAKRLTQQGLSVEQYYDISGLDAQGLLEQMMPVAEKRVKGRLVLEAVAKAEGLEATEEEYNKEISRLSARYLAGADEIRKLVAGKEENQIRTDIAIQKAMEFVTASSVGRTL